MSDDQNQKADSSPTQENFGPTFPVEEEAAPSPQLSERARALSYEAVVPEIPAAWSAQQVPPVQPVQPMYALPPNAGQNQMLMYGAASQGGYGYQFGTDGPPVTPLPLREAIRQLPRQCWRVLTKPSAAIFAAEQGKASWNIIRAQLGILSIISILAILFLFAMFFIFWQLFMQSMPSGPLLPDVAAQVYSIFGGVAVALVISSVVFDILAFFISTGFSHQIAKAFGGQGKFMPYCYGNLLIIIPIRAANIALLFIPCIGSTVAFAAVIYEVVLRVYMTMAFHRLSGGRASAAAIIPVVTFYFLIGMLYIAYYAFVFSLLRYSGFPIDSALSPLVLFAVFAVFAL